MVIYTNCLSETKGIILFNNEVCPFKNTCKHANLFNKSQRCWGTRKDRDWKFRCELEK